MKRLFQRTAALLCAALLLVAAPPVHAAGEDPFTMLFIGVDTSGKAGRSDVMMLARIDPDAGTVRLVSFLRDLYVSIPGHGYDRLNAACFYGGETLLLQTLEENFGDVYKRQMMFFLGSRPLAM